MTAHIRIVILAARLQPFLATNVRALLQREDVEIMLVHWPANAATPMPELPVSSRLKTIQKEAVIISIIEKDIEDFKPAIVLAPGWMDKEYLRWTKAARQRGAATIMSMDNQWNGSAKQHFNCLLSPYWLRKIYSHAWVPGLRQYHYARRLGFGDKHIFTGFCTPDVALFKDFFLTTRKTEIPKIFLYAGRLVAHKFEALLLAYSGLSAAQRMGWQLLVAGEGPLEHHPAMDDPDIIKLPFMPQQDLGKLIQTSSVFCLAGSDEPWGTAIQEYAIAGMPLLLSDACGAADHFLINGYNGYLCGSNVHDITLAMLRFIKELPPGLLAMGERSHQLGYINTNESWAATLLSVLL